MTKKGNFVHLTLKIVDKIMTKKGNFVHLTLKIVDPCLTFESIGASPPHHRQLGGGNLKINQEINCPPISD